MFKNIILLVGGLFLLVLAGCGSKHVAYSSVKTSDLEDGSGSGQDFKQKDVVEIIDLESWSCEKNTSHNENLNNSMVCVSSNGGLFYTGERGAKFVDGVMNQRKLIISDFRSGFETDEEYKNAMIWLYLIKNKIVSLPELANKEEEKWSDFVNTMDKMLKN